MHIFPCGSGFPSAVPCALRLCMCISIFGGDITYSDFQPVRNKLAFGVASTNFAMDHVGCPSSLLNSILGQRVRPYSIV